MSLIPKFKTIIKDGNVNYTCSMKDWINQLGNCEVEVTIKKWRNTRSNCQNKYFHGVVLPLLMEASGNSMEEMKNELKSQLLCIDIHKIIHGEPHVIHVIQDTRDLNTKQFEEFMKNCREYAWDKYETSIPLPNEYKIE